MELKNQYTRGMFQDPLPFLSPEGTYSLAMNAIAGSRNHKGFGLVNEESNFRAYKFDGTIKGHSVLKERDQTLVFIYNGNSEIWLFNEKDNTAYKVCSDNEFGDCKWGFDGCEFLYGEFKQFNGCNELHVYWSSDCVYHVVNIDEMANKDRKDAVIAQKDCTYFDVFSVTCGPHISAISAKNGGSLLEGGVIRFALQFQDNEGNTSNVFDVSQPVYIETENNIPGEVATTSAKLRIEGLNKKWNNVIIYVIHTVGQITTIRRMPAASYGDSGFTYEYYGQKGEIVDVSTIINKSKAWLRGQDLIQKDGRMFFYNIKNEKNLNYQKYANNIQLEFVEYEVTIEQQLKYHFPSLLRGEIYAFAIVWKFADGTYSDAYHIPGTPGMGVSGDSIQARSDTGVPPTSDSGPGAEGGTASGGDSSTESPVPATYNPIEPSNFDTTNQYQRYRNPDERKDRPNESDKLEDAVKTDISNIDTNEQDIIDAAECQDSLYGCGKLKEVYEDDIHDALGPPSHANDILSGMGKDDPDPDVNVSSDLKASSEKLIEDAVKNREYVVQKRPVLTYTQQDVTVSGTTPGNPEQDLQTEKVTFSQENSGQFDIDVPQGSGGTIRADNWVDGMGNPTTEQSPRVISRGPTEPWQSVVKYPDDKDCDGNYFYPQTNIQHHKMPETSDHPHYVSYQNGVVNKYQPDNYEYSKTFIRPLGIKALNIKFPDQDELPKPLCPKSPFKLVYVKRTDENKTIFAKGWLSGIFTGSVYGDTQAFPRHGVNSKETVDRSIAAGADGFSRKGTQSDGGVYTFHSPDTDADNSYLPITRLRAELLLFGSGWTHGHYAEGKKPVNQWTGTKKDQRGTRISNNLNHYLPSGVETDIVGFSYAPANSVVTKPPGMTYTLNNRFRESSVYLQTDSSVPGNNRDNSFLGVVMDHFFPTKANAAYASLKREVPDLYGSVDGLKYIDLGVVATQVHANGTKAIEGICGDTWIGPYTKKRTSYVSNKQGNFFNPPNKPGSPCRERSCCDSPEDKIFEYMGIDYYPTHLPKSGDIYDPKNYAGLHTVSGDCGAYGKSKTAAEASTVADSESDFYWPRVLKGLVHTIVESHVNPALLQTGPGSQVIEGKVYYPKLKDLYLDSDAPNKHPWEESFINRFYCALVQPSLSQLTRKTALRTFLNAIVPILTLLFLKDIEAVLDGVLSVAIVSAMNSMWVLMTNTLFTDERLNKMFGIPTCKRDEEGGDLDEDIEQFEDHYCKYNWDYSTVNDIESYYAFPLPFNTCDCDECLSWDTEVIMSDKSKKFIKDINIGDEVLSYDFTTNEYVNKKVTTKWDRGTKQVYRINFRNGSYVDATANHKWFVENAWNNYKEEVITTSELIESRKLPSNSKRPKYVLKYAGNIKNDNLQFLNESEAYVLGMYIAEGSRPHTNDNWKASFMVSQLKQSGRDKLEIALKSTRFAWKEHQKGFYISDAKDLTELFLQVNRGACNKNIPETLFRLDKPLLEKLYEGLFDGDGTRQVAKVDKGGFDIAARDTYYTCSESLIYDVALLANMIGKPGNVGSGIRSGFGSAKIQYYFNASEKGWLKTNNRLYVKSIEEIDPSETYDIEVEDTQSFVLARSLAISHNCNKTQTNNEIYYSNKQNLDSEIDAYRNVKMNNYNELPSHGGKLQKLFIQNAIMYAHATDGMWRMSLNQDELSNLVAYQQSGSASLLGEPQLMFEGVEGGFAGTTHPNASINTPFGYFFIDENARKVYRFTGGIPEEVSAYGMENFFKENLAFCNPKGCYDERTKDGVNYALGWDPRHNRLLLTKNDGDDCSSFTLSYTPYGEQGRWVSFHSYKPSAYSWNRNDFYSWNYGAGEIWKHHVKGNYQTFNGKLEPFMVEFTATKPDFDPFVFKSLILHTFAENTKGRYPVKDLDITFNKLAVWNSTQGTGTLPINLRSDNKGAQNKQGIPSNYGQVNFTKAYRSWAAQDIKDLILEGCSDQSLFIANCDCQVIPDINEGLFSCDALKKQNFNNRLLTDRYLTFRYTFDNRNDTRLHLIQQTTFDIDQATPTKE